MARPTRFERVASTFGGWRSIQLSYGRIKVEIPFETDRGQPQTSSYSKNNPDRNKCSADCHRSLSTTSCVLLPRCFRETKCVSVNSEQISQPIDFTAIFLFRCSAKIACICLRSVSLKTFSGTAISLSTIFGPRDPHRQSQAVPRCQEIRTGKGYRFLCLCQSVARERLTFFSQ